MSAPPKSRSKGARKKAERETDGALPLFEGIEADVSKQAGRGAAIAASRNVKKSVEKSAGKDAGKDPEKSAAGRPPGSTAKSSEKSHAKSADKKRATSPRARGATRNAVGSRPSRTRRPEGRETEDARVLRADDEVVDVAEAGENAGPAESRKPQRSYETAQSMAQRQREISISEFFAKNRHLLGFDSLPKALLTAVKEAVDNSLDACEEAGILPELVVEVGEIAENRYRVIVEDSGPGIVKNQIPKIFGKLLYGSKFHTLKQSRGQQGIGISAAVMYAQLTTGKPARVTSRTGARQPAHLYELQIDTKKNQPVILRDDAVEWERDHGTRIEMEILASYKKGQRSVDAYLHQVAIANPHARIVYRSPRNPEVVYERVAERLPQEARAIKPHPEGVELGVLLDMLKVSHARNVRGFLEHEFSRMSAKTASEVLGRAGLPESTQPRRITREQAEAIIRAFSSVKIMKPPTNCLSPIGEDLVLKSLEREMRADFYTAVTRPPAVYRGNPFQIEVGVAYGGTSISDEPEDGDDIPLLEQTKTPESGQPPKGSRDDQTIGLCRFANRAPLIYQQSACAITQSVINTAWKSYGVPQARGALPTGPMLLMVHIASAWVPFTSESKEAIAHYPEIIKEIKLGLQECGRRLARFIRSGVRAREEEKKRSYIEQYIPHIGIALREILKFPEKEERRLVEQLRVTLERSRKH